MQYVVLEAFLAKNGNSYDVGDLIGKGTYNNLTPLEQSYCQAETDEEGDEFEEDYED